MSKFNSTRDEVLFHVAFDSLWNDAHTGDTEAPTGYFGALSVTRADAPEIVKSTTGMFGFLDIEDAPDPADLVGHWLITEDTQGFVDISEHGDSESLFEEYGNLETAYLAWQDEVEFDG